MASPQTRSFTEISSDCPSLVAQTTMNPLISVCPLVKSLTKEKTQKSHSNEQTKTKRSPELKRFTTKDIAKAQRENGLQRRILIGNQIEKKLKKRTVDGLNEVARKKH